MISKDTDDNLEKIKKRFFNVDKSKTFKNIIKEHKLDKKAVFDIGCTYGEFLCHFGTGSVGLTIIKEEADYGQSIGLDIRQGNVESKDFKITEKFDVIFANNIFEHMLSPHLFLMNMKQYLKPDGVMILGVPSVPKLTWMLNFKRFRGSLASLHINFFNRDTLMKTVEAGGWHILTCRGFHFRNKYVDYMMNLVWPHFYVVAKPIEGFSYSPKRLKETAGYDMNSSMVDSYDV